MARSDDLGKGGTFPKRPASMDDSAKSERAEKKPRLSKINSKSSRKRFWSEVEDSDTNLEESEAPSTSRKIIRVGSTKKNDDGGENLVEQHHGTAESGDLEPNMQGSGRKLGQMGYVEKPQLSQRKWKRILRSADFGSLEHEDGSSAKSSRSEEEKMGKRKQIREHEVVRKVLQTVHLEEEKETVADHEEDTLGLEKDSGDRDKKGRGPDKTDASPPEHPEKKLRIDVPFAEASFRGAEQGVGVSYKPSGTWKRLKGHNPKPSAAASEEMGVSVSEAWKRLREERDTGTSGSSVNAPSDSDLSMHSSDSELETLEERTKKARHELPLPPSQGRKWRRKSREKKESSSSKRLREGNGCESSGSSGSEISHSSYFHNRKWKRPRFEYMMSMQGRAWRKQARYVDDARESARKRVQDDTSEKPTKRQRK